MGLKLLFRKQTYLQGQCHEIFPSVFYRFANYLGPGWHAKAFLNMTSRIESSNLLLRFVKKLPLGYHIFKIVFCSSGIARFSTYFCLIFPLRQPEVTTKKLCGMTSKNQNVILCKITVKYLQNVKILHANTNAKTWRF